MASINNDSTNNDSMEPLTSKMTPELRAHKKRQRARHRQLKQIAIADILALVPLSGPILKPGVKSFSDLYEAIVISKPLMYSFWSQVPDPCHPNAAVLRDGKNVLQERQRKLQRKLARQVERGALKEEEREEQWKKKGRLVSSATSSGGAPTISLLAGGRGQRKSWQVENFVTLLQGRLSNAAEPLTVVDFGCGSGNLCLALAAYFRKVTFVLVDRKPYSLELAQQRAEEAGLENVKVVSYQFSTDNLKSFKIPGSSNDFHFDIGIGLHSCGSFTDMVMQICRDRNADCIVCPCCNGAMTSKTTCGYQYPRSQFLRSCLNEEQYLSQLSKSADDEGNYPAKCLIEYDRAVWAKENGFRKVELFKMTPTTCTPKHHVLYLKQ